MRRLYLVIDLGTTQARVCLVDTEGKIETIHYLPIASHYPQPGWVEQDPLSLWQTVTELINQLLADHEKKRQIEGLALTNQRGTVIVWEKETGNPVYPAIVWQDRRQWDFVEVLTARPLYQEIRRKTGIIPSSAAMASKLRWILDKVPGVRQRAEAGELLAGTPDTWLLWKMTKGRVHTTDYSNASITGLFNLQTLSWDRDLLGKLAIPHRILAPEIKPSAAHYGMTEPSAIGIGVPIASVAGDQHSAMLGYGCIDSGQVQVTIGTGAFMLINTGNQPRLSSSGLATRVGFGTSETIRYGLEGAIYHSGTAIDFLRDIGILANPAESSDMAVSLPGNESVYFVPAFTGLGCPHWDDTARGAILGLTRGTRRAHIVRACLEAIGYQVQDILMAIQRELDFAVHGLHVGGGVARNDFAMQFLADITGIEVKRAANSETSVVGAAFLAALSLGDIPSLEDLPRYFRAERVFRPGMKESLRQTLYEGWQEALGRIIGGTRQDFSWQ